MDTLSICLVHPRACGEQVRVECLFRVERGSSPRLRGTGNHRCNGEWRRRFIPAPAGNGDTLSMVSSSGSVHPRACGEQIGSCPAPYGNHGSSPRLRGTVLDGFVAVFHSRFIPAPAGNRSRGPEPRHQSSVHPRACGEQFGGRDRVSVLTGSSPRLRGTVQPVSRPREESRFIPAPAGNSPKATNQSRKETVHPRACGEQAGTCDGSVRVNGSSPRLRGTAMGVRAGVLVVRFIPAPAGNSCTAFRLHWWETVHPRACGEQSRVKIAESLSVGSSPRLRGTGPGWGRSRHLIRFIPAPAGNSATPASEPCPPAVHPRACGEQVDWGVVCNLGGGSSPRLRGTAESPFDPTYVLLFRFIPAPAGNRTIPFAPLNSVHPRACGEQLRLKS